MILVVWLVGCFSALIIVLVRFFVGLSCSCASGTTLGSAASSVVIDLGFCGVSTTALRLSSDQLFSASRRTLRAYTASSSVRTRVFVCEVALSSLTLGFHLSANFGAGFPDPFPTSGRCARTVSPNSTNFHGKVRPWHDRMATVPHYLGNEE